MLILLLDAWSKNGADFASQLPDDRFFDDAQLFRRAASEPTELGYTEIVQFVGYIAFMRIHEDAVDPNAFQEWMRVVFNLSLNTSYDRPADMQRSISGLLKMASNSGDILQFFATTEKPTAGFSPQQISEEKFKAELILADSRWRPLIDRAERHGYFRGQIEFLLDFCGALEMWKNGNDVNWGTETHSSLQQKFESYLGKAEAIFTTQGLVDFGNYRLERALLSIGNYLLPSGRQNDSFLVNSSTEQASWKRLLRGTGPKVPEARKLLHQLLDHLTPVDLESLKITKRDILDSLKKQLDEIIASAAGLEPWMEAIVRTPEAISYCERKAIRWNSPTNVYLLSKTQMNGSHAELFTFCLYHNSLIQIAKEGRLSPLNLHSYLPVVGADLEPGIRFALSHENCSAFFEIEFSGGEYLVYVSPQSMINWPELALHLKNVAGFTEEAGRLSKRVSPANIEAMLLSLAHDLAIAFSNLTPHV